VISKIRDPTRPPGIYRSPGMTISQQKRANPWDKRTADAEPNQNKSARNETNPLGSQAESDFVRGGGSGGNKGRGE